MALGTPTKNTGSGGAASEPLYVDDISFALDNSYPAGGYPGLEAKLRVLTGDKRTIVDVLTAVDLSGHAVAWDFANGKLKLFRSGGANAVLAEVVAAVDLSAVTLRLRVASK